MSGAEIAAVRPEGMAGRMPDDTQRHYFRPRPNVSINDTPGTVLLILRVTIKGMTAPAATMETAMELKAFHENIMPWYKVWGGFSMASDGLVCGCSGCTYALPFSSELIISDLLLVPIQDERLSSRRQKGLPQTQCPVHRDHVSFRMWTELCLLTVLRMPPVIGIFIMDVQSNLAAAPTGE